MAGIPRITSVLLDRDGTLIADRHYLSDPDGVELLPGVGRALANLAGRGLRFFLVSNQSGIGRGYFSQAQAVAVNRRLDFDLRGFNVALADTLFCPHAPQDACHCRKPDIGMWRELQKRHGLVPEQCLMVGDKIDDMLFAANAGLALRALALTGHGRAAAEKLDLDVARVPFFDPAPPTAAHPHLALFSLADLPEALDSFCRSGA